MALPSFIEMLLLMTPNFAADMQHKDAITEFHQSQSINQFTFSVFRTHQGSQQTITAKILRMLSLNETGHSMLFYATSRNFAVKRLHLHAINRRRSPSTVHLTSCKSLCLAQHASCAQENICCSSLIEQISQIRT